MSGIDGSKDKGVDWTKLISGWGLCFAAGNMIAVALGASPATAVLGGIGLLVAAFSLIAGAAN